MFFTGLDTGTPIPMPALGSGSMTVAGDRRSPPTLKPKLPFLEGWNTWHSFKAHDGLGASCSLVQPEDL